MSVDVCLLAKAEAGKVDKRRASTAAAKFRTEADQLASDAGIPASEAERLTAARMAEDGLRAVARRKRMDLKQAAVQADITAQVQTAVAAGRSVEDALKAKLALDARGRFKGVSNVEAREQVVRGRLHKEMTDFFVQFRSKGAGLYSNRANLKNVVREMFGEDTGNRAASDLAKGVQAMDDYAIKRFNAAGGDVVRSGLKVKHDRASVAAVSEDDWVDNLAGLLNRQEMLDGSGRPMTDEALDVLLRNTYRKVISAGLGEQASAPGSFGSTVNARAHESNLVFRDADAWIDYHERFGGGSLYDHVVGMSESWAKDIAEIEILGPSPEATLAHMEYLMDLDLSARASGMTGKEAAKAAEKIGQPKDGLRSLYRAVRGLDNRIVSRKLHNLSGGFRNLITSSALGSATLAAVPSDLVTLAATAKMNGMPAMRASLKALSTFSTNSRADRELAIRLGFTARGYADRALGAQRILGEVVGPAWTEKVAEVSLRATGLNAWTEAAQWGMQTIHLAHLTGQAGKSFDQLDGMTQRSMGRYGISASEWDVIRNAPMYRDPESGATFISAENVAGGEFSGQGFDAANKLQEMLHSEVQYAVISPNARVRALVTANQPSGTFWGEAIRSVTQFKSFVLALGMMHGGRTIARQGAWHRAAYGVGMFGSLLIAGAVTEQLASIASGKKPVALEDLDDDPEVRREFFQRALVRGGAMGLFGDVLFSFENNYAGGLTGLLGPGVDTLNEIGFLAYDSGRALLGEDNQAGKRFSQLVQKVTPGRSGWYYKLALERLIFDQLDKELNPNYRRSFRAMENRAKDDLKQRYWWKPGDISP